MSSLIRRIEIRMMKKAEVEKVLVATFKTDEGPRRIYHWPRRVPASAIASSNPREVVKRPARGSRRGKHSKAWIEARQAARA